MNGLFAAWLVEAAIVTARRFGEDHRPPLPSEFLASFIIFGGLATVVAPSAPKVANITAWGIVIATFLAPAAGQSSNAAIGALRTIGDFMSGGASTSSSSQTAGQSADQAATAAINRAAGTFHL